MTMPVVPESMMVVLAWSVTACPLTLAPAKAKIQYLQAQCQIDIVFYRYLNVGMLYTEPGGLSYCVMKAVALHIRQRLRKGCFNVQCPCPDQLHASMQDPNRRRGARGTQHRVAP